MPTTRDGKTWRSQFYYEDWQGIRHKKNKRGFKTKAEAEEWERNFRQQQRKDLDINFENFVEIYFADVENRLRESTSLTELQDKMHKYAEQEMNEHPEIFEGEDLKEIEKGRNSDWSKEFFVRKKAEALESLNEQYAETTNAVEVNETVLEELNKQTEETIQTMVETEAQKEFMRYAFLKEPKTPIGKLVAGAWRKFKEWWDIHKRKEVEEKTRESVLGRLAELKKETKEHPRTPVVPKNTGKQSWNNLSLD